MNNNRNWEREKREQDPEANCLSGWHSVSHSICQTVCVFLSVSCPEPKFPGLAYYCYSQAHAIQSLFKYFDLCSVFFCLAPFSPTPGPVFTLTQCLYHLAL